MYCSILRVILFALILQAPCLMAQKNKTVQDNDSRITYTPRASWMSLPDVKDSDGKHMMTMDRTASATFTFKGTAVYLVHPLWPYLVTSAVSVDNGTAKVIYMQDPYPPGNSDAATADSRATLVAENLADEEHTLRISIAEGAQHTYAVLDALIYTYSDLDSTPSPSPNKPKDTAPATDAVKLRRQNRTLIIAMSAVAGVLSLLLAALFIWYCNRRRDDKPAYQAAPGKDIYEPSSVPSQGYVSTQPSTNDFGTRPGPNLYQVAGDGSTLLSYHSSHPSRYSDPSWFERGLPDTAYGGTAPDLNSTLVRLSGQMQPQAPPPSHRYYETLQTTPYDPYSPKSIAGGSSQPINQVTSQTTSHPVAQSSTQKPPLPTEYPAELAPPPRYGL